MNFIYNDGGRETAGFKGNAGDCVVRAVAIATEQPYQIVYNVLSNGVRTQRLTQRGSRKRSARDGVNTNRKWFRHYMAELGWRWTPTMHIGSGCKVHLHDGELPTGRLIVAVSRHLTTVIDGVVHDTHDPQRETHTIALDRGQELRPGEWRNVNGICSIQRRCVYGYWSKAN